MSWTEVSVVAAIAAAAINTGAFFAFSNFVMPALAKLADAEAAKAMQEINIAAPSKLFVATIFGAGLVTIPAIIADATLFLILGAALSVASFLVTMLFNVPRNNRLDRDAAHWPEYLTSWTRGNTVRTLTSLASVIAYAYAL